MTTQTHDKKGHPFLSRAKGFITSPSFLLGGLSVVCSLLLIAIVLMAITPVRYKLFVGMVPTQTIVATKDVVDEVTTEKNRRAAADSVTPTYKYQEGVTEQVLKKLDDIRQELSNVIQYAKTLDDYAANKRYTEDELQYAASMLSAIQLRGFQLQSLLNIGEEEFEELFNVLNDTVKNTMQTNITQGQETTAVNSIMAIIGYKLDLNMLQNVAYPILRAVIMPNMVIDKTATDEARQAAMAAVEPVVFKQGQNIVVRGEGRVTDTQIKMLSSLGLLSSNKTDYRTYLGAGVIVLITLILFNTALSLLASSVYSDLKRLFILYIVMVLTLLITVITKALHVPFLAPMLFAATLLTVTVGHIPALAAHIALSVLGAFVLSVGGQYSSSDLVYILPTGLVAGAYACLMLKDNVQRGRILAIGALAGIVSFLMVLGIGLMLGNEISSLLQNALLAAGGCLLSALLAIGFQPILESLFNLPTQSRLLDLCNPTQPLLHRLLTEAPGTYHHSIIIANLAETSAEAIKDANPLLARVGGYYHDIGKLKRPLYFKENQIGTANVHDETDPQVSAAIITAHVRDGLAMAKQYRLPLELQQIIAEHHGNSLVMYFFSKAVQTSGADQVDQSEYRYDGTPPRSKEGAIVMLCDTIEAAVRTLSKPTREEIQAFILKLIQQKIDDGQLQNAPLTLKDLHHLAEACTAVLYGVFHERIEYPDASKKRPWIDPRSSRRLPHTAVLQDSGLKMDSSNSPDPTALKKSTAAPLSAPPDAAEKDHESKCTDC